MASEGNRGLIVLVVLLVAGLVAVMYFWQQDQESQDVEIDLGEGTSLSSPPALVLSTDPHALPLSELS